MGKLLSIILFLIISTISNGQQGDFDPKKIKFKGLEFSTTKDAIIKAFGSAKKADTNYTCGFFSNDESGAPYYQLVYPNFNYIGSDKEKFYLQNVTFDLKGEVKMKYGDNELSGQTTKEEFVKIFGPKAKEHFDKYPNEDTLLLLSNYSDDGAKFIFRNGRLIKFEYWTPC